MGVFELASRIVKFVLIAIVYSFILRVVKMVYLDISDTKRARRAVTEGMAYLKLSGRKKDMDYKVYDTYAVRENTFVGRARKNDICIPAPFMSGVHAKIFFADGEFYIEDLGSTNGTLVNGKYTGNYTVPLKSGDKIGFGNIKFVFVENDE
ncbi:MAG: FHA domain-containing protein [Clostridia bacterium]|nr:FHA domain-containing protein [Clostridia bacterium]